MMYQILYWMMVIGYFGISVSTPTLRLKIIGLLLTVVNALLFWRTK